ncbi:MAG TPA: ABC transporter substrate-binding protein [Armatimonadota bacterium]|nr:ABC transporter substrate-binding protein [Armatimonadota bacterium]
MLRKLLLCLGVAAVTSALAGCPPSGGGGAGGGGGSAGSGPILVGYYGDLTGGTATFGISTREGIDLAVDEINQKPPLGRPLEIRGEDDQGKSEQAVSVVTKLITQDQVVAVLGEVASSNSLAAAPVCQQNNIPMITPASTNTKVTQVGDYIFRICFIDPFQGSVMAKFAFNTLKAKRAAILWDVKSDYSKGLLQSFRETFTGLGGQVVAEPSYAQGDSDFNAQLNSIKGAKPDVIFIPGYYTEVGTISRQARDQGIDTPLIGADGWDSPKLFEGAGATLKGGYMSNHYSAESKDPQVQDFITKYKAKYNGKTPDAMAALGYDAARILAEAITRAGNTDGPALRDAIAQTKSFAGVTGEITLDAERNATKPAVVLRIGDKAYEYVETVQP